MAHWLDRQNRTALWVVSLCFMALGAALLFSTLPSQADNSIPSATPETAGQSPDRAAGDAVPEAAAMPTLIPVRLALPQPFPPSLTDSLQAWLQQHPEIQVITDTQTADLSLTMDLAGDVAVERVYVPVARFATVQDEVAASDLLALWMRGPEGAQPPLAVDADTAAALSLLWGPPAQVEIFADVPALATALWQSPGRLGIVPFDRLVPELKALTIAGNDPTDNQFTPDEYPLVLRLSLTSRPDAEPLAASLRQSLVEAGAHTNRNPDKLTTLIMTGVTAMARMTALRMEQKGYDYPAKIIGPALSAADLTHISNEIPFVAGCEVDPTENNLTLCSKPEYLQALRDVGVDLVGLTGNHLNDFGATASLASLQFYADQNLPTYGGGANAAAAWQPLLVEHNGNRLVFVGANSFGPVGAWATADSPGAAAYSLEAMTQAIAGARQQFQPDLVLAEMQWEESYDTLPIQSQQEGFRQIKAAGADIVTGVQSHVPQGMEFRDGGLILYGLGNLFFDQMWSQPTREGLIPRHTIYDGRLLSTKLLTTMLEDFAQPRWTTEQEREDLLERVFTASGWW